MKLRRSLTAFLAGTVLALGLAACTDDIQPDAAPVLHVLKEKHGPNHLEMTLHIVTNATPQKFEAYITIYKFKNARAKHGTPVAGFRRTIHDVPNPGDGLTWRFPDPAAHEQPLTCENGDYYAMWRIVGTTAAGTHQDTRFFYPYDISLPKYKFAPSPKRSWHVNCRKTGRVPDPHGE